MIKPNRIFLLFVTLHVLAWTLAPTLFRTTLPMDAMEGFTWGHQLILGYDKNPFLNAWLTALAVTLGGKSGWMVYFFSQLSVAGCFWAVYQLGKKMLSPLYALVSVLMLEGLQYYNFHAIDFNDNTLELSLWALLILFFWQAVTKQKNRDWLLTGLFAGLGMLAKYYTVVLLIPLILFLLATEKNRQLFLRRGFYLASLVFLLVIAPHGVWLFSHDFITVQYAFARTNLVPAWQNHVFYPAQFFWQQLEVVLPGLLLLLPFCFGKATPPLVVVPRVNRFDRLFLLYAGLGPLLVTVLLSCLFGMKLRAGWGQPLLSLTGLLVLALMRPHITKRRLKVFFALVAACFMLIVTGYCLALQRAGSPSSANFPGDALSEAVTRVWHARYHRALCFVVGPRWYAGNVAFYAPEQPAVYMEANPRVSPWIDEKQLRKVGAVFIWETGNREFEAGVRQRFPMLGSTRVWVFPRSRNATVMSVSVAFLPPGQRISSGEACQ